MGLHGLVLLCLFLCICDEYDTLRTGCDSGYYGDMCDNRCSVKTPRCTQCEKESGLCTACSSNFKPPQCSACQDYHYKSISGCVRCESRCPDGLCDRETGTCTLENVVLGKTYSQNFTSTGNGHLAADGDFSTCFTPLNIVGSRWKVDLGRKYPMSNISVFTSSAFTFAVDGRRCNIFTTSEDDPPQHTINCDPPIYGQAVRLTADGSAFLDTFTLCEVQIWLCIDGRYGTNCDSLCSTLTPGCSQCFRNNGQCAACQDGYYIQGTTCVQCSNCVNQQCNSETGRCILACPVGFYGRRCDIHCSKKTPQCSQCERDSGQCTVCSGLFKPPQCTVCEDGYYKEEATCIRCSSTCVNRQCDPANGKCTPGCPVGHYGDRCDYHCSEPTRRCTQCEQDSGQCTACSGQFKPPQCTGCEDGYYMSDATCVQCSNCVNRLCNSDTGRCTLGCPVGYYGDRCDIQCSTNAPRCTQCDQDGGQCTACSGQFKPPQCTACDDGYYKSGTTCVECSSNCVNRQCDPASGKCALGCQTGVYGDTCETLCSTNAVRCIQCVQDDGTCTACSGNFKPPQCSDCQDGYYRNGKTCVHCSNCVNQQCDSENGSCKLGCPSGYYGDRCDSHCSDRIPQCSLCDQDNGLCIVCSGHFKPPHCIDCEDGYYKSGTTCVQCSKCTNRQCDSGTGRCTLGCPAGYYGERCDSECSTKTLRCTQCDQDGGQCTACSGQFKPPQCTVCDDGYYKSGTACVQCSSICVNRQCDPASGKCILGCPTGLYGDTCESRCSANTVRCIQCVQDDGTCTACSGNFKPPQCADCHDGYYRNGKTCVHCSNCVNQQCDPENGSCKLGCPSGYYGDRCDSRCTDRTQQCSLCDQDNGQCTMCNGRFKPPLCTDCQDGYYKSSTACIRCSTNCLNGECDFDSGRCTLGCHSGYYGNGCDSRCSAQCSECIQDTGECTACSGQFKPPLCTVCQDGFYKHNLSCVPCGTNCLNRQCDPASGNCTLGCISAFYGDKCYSRCSVQTPGCMQCTQDGGQCTDCSGDFKSPQCTETLREEIERRTGLLVAAVGCSIVGVMIIIAIVLTVVFCRRLRSKRNARKKENSPSVPSPQGRRAIPTFLARRPWLDSRTGF